MRTVTPNKVLPEWAIYELSQIADLYGLKITVRQVLHNLPQLNIAVECGESIFHFRVSMSEDWEDLLGLGEGDLWATIRFLRKET
jgi:hypothetical protein